MSSIETTKQHKFAEAFNEWVIKFFRELIKMYPSNQDFKMAKSKLTVLSQSPQFEMPIQLFEKYISEYREHLRTKNDQFFLEFDLSGTSMDFLNYVKDLWKSANQSTKDTMFKYFIIFDKLSEKYHS